VAHIAKAEPADLQLTFSPEDRDFLSQSTAGRTVEVRATAMSDKLPLAVTVYEGERIVASRTIRVGVQVRRLVVIATCEKRRGETIAREDLAAETQWVALTASPATIDQLAGAVVRTRIPMGQAIQTGDVSPPIIVNKGDQVTVHCVSGSVVLTTRARAMAQARDGESIEFQALDSKRRFTARMNGKGRAVVANPGEVAR
jgi:flagella basal body P-ring formation protein FlgA